MRREIKLFTSDHCEPCKELKELIEKGRFESDIEAAVRMVDVESEEGFSELQQNMDQVEAIPAAVYNGKSCRIQIDDEAGVIVFSCADPTDE